MKYLLIIPIVLFLFLSCKKEGCTDQTAINYDEKAKEDDGSCKYDTIIPFEFVSLTVSDDTIMATGSADITAVVNGTGITYTWTSVNGQGDIIGSGNTVSFVTSPCMLGDYEISCKAEDYSGATETKSVIINVYL